MRGHGLVCIGGPYAGLRVVISDGVRVLRVHDKGATSEYHIETLVDAGGEYEVFVHDTVTAVIKQLIERYAGEAE